MIALLLSLALAGGDFCDDEASASEAAATLKSLFDADAEAALDTSSDAAKARADRAKTAAKMLKKGEVCTAQDQYHAAQLLRRSTEVEDIVAAYDLAQAAMMEHVPGAAWLTAVAYDLREVSRGSPQRYASATGHFGQKICIYPIAADSTDKERAQYGLPKLTEAYRALLTANGYPEAEPATEANLANKNLFCKLKPW